MPPIQSRPEKIVDLEYEIKVFEAGVQSPFWKLLCDQWKPIVDAATGQALSGQAVDRGFLAGKANGLHYFLKYPEKHIKKMQNDLKTYRGV